MMNGALAVVLLTNREARSIDHTANTTIYVIKHIGTSGTERCCPRGSAWGCFAMRRESGCPARRAVSLYASGTHGPPESDMSPDIQAPVF